MATAITLGELIGETLTDLLSVPKGFAQATDYGAVGNGTTNDRAAIAAADATGLGVFFPGGRTYKINSNLTITSVCIFGYGAKLSIPTGITLTLSSGVIAGTAQVLFTCAGTGKAIFGAVQHPVYPAWFGATGDGSTDDSAAVQLAISALSSSGGEIIFPRGVFNLNNTHANLSSTSYKIRGAGKGVTIIKAKGTATSLFQFDPAISWTASLINATSVKFEDITFQADSATSQDLLYISTLFPQPPKITLRVVDCEFKFTDHTTNHSGNMVHLLNMAGARFERCEWDVDYASGGGESGAYGIGVYIDGTGGSFVQDVRFTDCAWYFITGVFAYASGGDVECVQFHNCHMVGQGLNGPDPDDVRHYGVKAFNVTDFQWIGGESTGITGMNFWFDGAGPYHIDHCHMTNNRVTGDGTPMIRVDNSSLDTDIEFSHIFATQDGTYPTMFSILLNPGGVKGFFGSVHDCLLWDTGAGHAVSDPGPGAGALSFVQYHHSYRGTTTVASGVP